MIGKPDCELSRQTGFCEKNAVFKKISEIHFSSDYKNFTDMNSGSQNL